MAQLRPRRIHREIRAPEQPLDAHRFDAALEHAAVRTAAREIEENVARPPPPPQRGERVLPGPPPPHVRGGEVHGPVTPRAGARPPGGPGLPPRPLAPP